MEFFIDDDEPEHLFVCRMEPYYTVDAMVPLGSEINVWYRSDENFDMQWYNNEKDRRDSIAEAWRLKRYSADTIKYLIDSFNYILRNSSFSYDTVKRQQDNNMMYENNVDPSYFYDE